MNIANKLRRGEGRFWGTLKRCAKAILHAHLPVRGHAKPFFRLLYAAHVAAREGVSFLLRVLWYEPLFRGQCAEVGDRLYMEQLPYLVGHGRIRIGENVKLSGKSTF